MKLITSTTVTILMVYQAETTIATVGSSRFHPTELSLPVQLLEPFFLLASSQALYYCISARPRSDPRRLKPTLAARLKSTQCRLLESVEVAATAATAETVPLIKEVAKSTVEHLKILAIIPELHLNPTTTRQSVLCLWRPCRPSCPL